MRLAALLLIFAACAHNPATGALQLALVSEAEEIELGKRGLVGMRNEFTPIDDAPIAAYVSEFGMVLARESARPHLPWSFTVLDDPLVNAFALPGGQIIVTRGLLAYMRNEADLAIVLGHEVAHVAARHTATMLSHQELLKRSVSASTRILPGTWANAVNDAAGKGAELLFLQYGRADEREADFLGFHYAVNNGFDGRAGATVFATLGELNQAGAAPAWLSSHPSAPSRVEAVWEEAAKTQVKWETLKVNDERYARKLDGMIFGDDPRQGYVEGSYYYHPALRFSVAFDGEFTLTKKGNTLFAVDAANEAIIELRVVPETGAAAESTFVSARSLTPTGRYEAKHHGQTVTGVAFSGAAHGFVRFWERDKKSIQMVLTVPDTKLAAVESRFEAIVASLQSLTEPKRLQVKVPRVRAFKTPRTMTLAQVQEEAPSIVPLATLALMNGVKPDEPIPAGRWLKRVSE